MQNEIDITFRFSLSHIFLLDNYESINYNVMLQPGEDYSRLYGERVGSGLSRH